MIWNDIYQHCRKLVDLSADPWAPWLFSSMPFHLCRGFDQQVHLSWALKEVRADIYIAANFGALQIPVWGRRWWEVSEHYVLECIHHGKSGICYHISVFIRTTNGHALAEGICLDKNRFMEGQSNSETSGRVIPPLKMLVFWSLQHSVAP